MIRIRGGPNARNIILETRGGQQLPPFADLHISIDERGYVKAVIEFTEVVIDIEAVESLMVSDRGRPLNEEETKAVNQYMDTRVREIEKELEHAKRNTRDSALLDSIEKRLEEARGKADRSRLPKGRQ